MTISTPVRPPGPFSILMITASIAVSVTVSLAMDAILLAYSRAAPAEILIGAALFNGTVILQSVVGGIIEWRRPGHTIGRLLMLSGPLYAFLSAGWLTAETLQPLVDPGVYQVVNWAGSVGSWPGVALIIGWVPLLFPTGSLPGPRWRIPAGILVVVSGIGLVALAVRPGPLNDATGLGSPIAIEGWPSFLQVFVDAIPLELLALVLLAVAGLITRYRRGGRVERLQIRWFGAAVAVCGIGIAATAVQATVQTDGGPLLMALVLYAGILAMPIAIGIAVTRYRLYEIDRLISRGLSWGVLTGVLVAVYAAGVLVLQGALAGVTQGETLAVAASTLIAAAIFQPLRRRVQRAMDRRFDRARYDGERTAAAFAERLRDEIDIDTLSAEVRRFAGETVRPVSSAVWLRIVPDSRETAGS